MERKYIEASALKKALQDAEKEGLTLREFAERIESMDGFCESVQWFESATGSPGKDGWYLATLDGEICGEEGRIVGMSEFRGGHWLDADEEIDDLVYAWTTLPAPFSGEAGEELAAKMFWRRIEEACRESGLTKTEIAEKMGTARKTLYGIGGKKSMTSSQLARFCNATGASADWLLGIRKKKISIH